MFRSISTRRGPGKYEKLDKESATATNGNGPLNPEELKRSTSLPSGASSLSIKMAQGSTFGNHINLQRNPTKKANGNKNEKISHPLFSFFDLRKKKKATARPEFLRYIEYLKEGGSWDKNSNKPVMYYK